MSVAAAACRRHLGAALGVLAIALAAGAGARADLAPCAGLDSQSTDYKVLLDEITYISPETPIDPAVLEFAMNRLKGKLEMALQELQLQEDVRIDVVRCERRKPRESDFAPDVAETLGNRRVLVEVWGDVLASEAGASRSCMASVKYVLIPVRGRAGESAYAFHEVDYESELTGPADRLLDLFEGTPELRAFAAIGAGLDRLAVDEYDLARTLLCKADGLLRLSRPASDPLLAYVEQISLEVLEQARADTGYRGLLKSPGIGACHAGI